ncbi:hypothetical protein [Nocardia sp. alder85J]|uniref:hypothetical protein n=1 Tax=Nocardia sp. alder85J TaxID=2862949 RepID=UPI001CD73087|nr:hypothetical protein [Nocardia sp. alder85J]MCX4091236.1 hypothetical protein [Nocardia sp. alder85J]
MLPPTRAPSGPRRIPPTGPGSRGVAPAGTTAATPGAPHVTPTAGITRARITPTGPGIRGIVATVAAAGMSSITPTGTADCTIAVSAAGITGGPRTATAPGASSATAIGCTPGTRVPPTGTAGFLPTPGTRAIGISPTGATGHASAVATTGTTGVPASSTTVRTAVRPRRFAPSGTAVVTPWVPSTGHTGSTRVSPAGSIRIPSIATTVGATGSSPIGRSRGARCISPTRCRVRPPGLPGSSHRGHRRRLPSGTPRAAFIGIEFLATGIHEHSLTNIPDLPVVGATP